METYKIKTANACYTGGGLYIYYGQLENGLYFQAYDEWETIYICDTETGTEEAQYTEFYEQHTVEELEGEAFKAFWNQIIGHIISGGPLYDDQHNYLKSDLLERIIK